MEGFLLARIHQLFSCIGVVLQAVLVTRRIVCFVHSILLLVVACHVTVRFGVGLDSRWSSMTRDSSVRAVRGTRRVHEPRSSEDKRKSETLPSFSSMRALHTYRLIPPGTKLHRCFDTATMDQRISLTILQPSPGQDFLRFFTAKPRSVKSVESFGSGAQPRRKTFSYIFVFAYLSSTCIGHDRVRALSDKKAEGSSNIALKMICQEMVDLAPDNDIVGSGPFAHRSLEIHWTSTVQ